MSDRPRSLQQPLASVSLSPVEFVLSDRVQGHVDHSVIGPDSAGEDVSLGHYSLKDIFGSESGVGF